jgi:hypothetical protein
VRWPRTIVGLSRQWRRDILRIMDTAHLLSAFGLVIGTVEYSLLVWRRAKLRRLLREVEVSRQLGLQGLVRVLLVDR